MLTSAVRQTIVNLSIAKRGPVGKRGCVDPGSCSDGCSALAQQIAEADACADALLDDLSSQWSVSKSDLTSWQTIESHPSPASDLGDAGDFTTCTRTGGVQQPNPCASLILCADGAMPSAGPGGECICGSVEQIASQDFCAVARCIEGVPDDQGICPDLEPPSPSSPVGVDMWERIAELVVDLLWIVDGKLQNGQLADDIRAEPSFW